MCCNKGPYKQFKGLSTVITCTDYLSYDYCHVQEDKDGGGEGKGQEVGIDVPVASNSITDRLATAPGGKRPTSGGSGHNLLVSAAGSDHNLLTSSGSGFDILTSGGSGHNLLTGSGHSGTSIPSLQSQTSLDNYHK